MSFAELVAARGDLNTLDQLTACSLFNKVFVANGTIHRVLDFQNVKITYGNLSSTSYGPWTATSATATTITVSGQAGNYADDAMNGMYLYVSGGTGTGEYAYITDFNGTTATFTFGGLSSGTVPDATTAFSVYRKQLPVYGDVLTGATSGARLVVDFITKAAGPGTLYCKKLDTTAVQSGELLVGTSTVSWNSSLGDISFATTSTETAGPHWYEWTSYGDDPYVFGELPDSFYLVAPYSSRLFIAGSSDEPNQWWVSKCSNPWMYAIEVNNDLSANYGLAGNLGEAGDLIRALIPVKDDRILLGCANSIRAIVGNPSPYAGGEMNEVDLTHGIWGAKSWCYDGSGSLYYISPVGGLCKMNMVLYTTEVITSATLPKLLSTLNPATHRIELAYESTLEGIWITITDLVNATGSAYFYSIVTGGLFLVVLQDENAVYSAVSFVANDPTKRGVLFGCRDGYVREFNATAKSDDVGSTDAAISASVALPVMALSKVDEEGRMRSITLSTGGGEASGTYTDTDAVTISIYTGDDAEEVAEKIRDAETPDVTGTVTGAGRQLRFRSRARGRYAGIVLSNNTAYSSFAINKVVADLEGGEE